MDQRTCATCGESSPTRTCDRCKWEKRPRVACVDCGRPTGWAESQRERAGDFPRCRGCFKAAAVTHGGVGRYRKGCRCSECRAAQAAYMRRYAAARKLRDPNYRAKWRATEYAKARANYTYTDELRQRDTIRRARKAGATVERFDNCEVFERDGWICLICLLPTDRTAVWPDPNMPSLDHVVPLSLGGEHSRANTRCTHLGCNVKRGNRV